MGAVLALDVLLEARTVWRGQAPVRSEVSGQPTGHAVLDARLPGGGWPGHALVEVLMPADGVGELGLVFPTLARLTQAGERVLLITPPYRVHAPGWAYAGVALRQLHVVEAASDKDALWAAEQALRSAACAAVLCWPRQADDKALRRLQVASESGQCLGFAFRDAKHARNPSPAAVRLQLDRQRQVRVLKCRGGLPSDAPLALASAGH